MRGRTRHKMVKKVHARLGALVMKKSAHQRLGTPFADLRVSSPEEIRSSQGKGCNEEAPPCRLPPRRLPRGRTSSLTGAGHYWAGAFAAGGGRPAGAGSVSGSLPRLLQDYREDGMDLAVPWQQQQQQQPRQFAVQPTKVTPCSECKSSSSPGQPGLQFRPGGL